MPDNLRDADQKPDDAEADIAEVGAGADWEALARYSAGESAPAEVAAVRAWLASHPAAAALVDSVLPRAVPAPAEPSVDVERALATVRARIVADAARGAEHPPALTVSTGGARKVAASSGGEAGGAPRARREEARPWYAGGRGLAAAAALFLAIGFGTREILQRDPASPPALVAARVYETAIGVRDSVTLADGSRVILAPGSRMTVPASFDSERTVDLDGAAYFEVRHDEAHPFTVRSRGAEVRDIGTAFSVTTDATGSVSVAVTEGIVAMRSTATPGAKGVELKAGDRGVIHGHLLPDGTGADLERPTAPGGDGEVDVTRGSVTVDDMAWTRGDLSYRDAPLSIVQADLRRWYGINLVVTDSVLLRRTLTISFRGDAAAGALRKVALTLGAETEQRGDTVLLRTPAAASGDRR
ncbi:MAG: FecR domain-containing protein [Gemmatimonadota bacterium]